MTGRPDKKSSPRARRHLRRVAFAFTLGGAFSHACSVYNSSLLEDIDDDGGDMGGATTGGDASTGGKGGNPSGGSGGAVSGGMGGETESGGSGTGSESGTGGATPSSALEMIDDLEDNEPGIIPFKMRNGRWNIYASAGEDPPEPGADFTEMTDVSSDPPHGESAFAATMKSGGHSEFGAVLNVTMRSWPNYEETPTYDASSYTGLNFYARVGSGSSKTLRVRLVTGDTDPRGGECLTEGDIGELCFDHFLYPVTLKESWQRYEIAFSDFGQTGAGKQFDNLALDRLYTIEFHMPGSGDFELWVDDLQFVLPE